MIWNWLQIYQHLVEVPPLMLEIVQKGNDFLVITDPLHYSMHYFFSSISVTGDQKLVELSNDVEEVKINKFIG